MDRCKVVNTPVECGTKFSKHIDERVDPTQFKSLVGSLRYLTCIRPDMLYGVGLTSHYMERLLEESFNISKVPLILVYYIHVLY